MAIKITGDDDHNVLNAHYYEDSFLEGLGGNDVLLGGTGDDILSGGSGDDELIGRGGNNVFLFGRGDGQDRVTAFFMDGDTYNTIRFGIDIAPEDILVERMNDSLVLRIRGTDDQITLVNYFLGDSWNSAAPLRPNSVEEIRFHDGATWHLDDILAQLAAVTLLDDSDNSWFGGSVDGKGGNDDLTGMWSDDVLRGGDGDDRLDGGDGNDVLEGGAGNDFLMGGLGANTFQFARGWGHDTIVLLNDYAPASSYIEFADVLPGSLSFIRTDGGQGNDLLITLLDTGESITIAGYFDMNSSQAAQTVQIRFAGHTLWTYDDIKQAVYTPPGIVVDGTDGDDYLPDTGPGNDTLSGGLGDDFLQDGAGDDVLIGGAGNDILNGADGGGNNVFLGGDGDDHIHAGDGNDTIDAGSGNDVIVAGPGHKIVLFGRNAGWQQVNTEFGATFTIVLGADIDVDDIMVVREDGWAPSPVSIVIKETGSKISLSQLYVFDYETGQQTLRQNVEIKFADGTVWDTARLVRQVYTGDEQANVIFGSQYNDEMDGRDGDDVLSGLAGDDRISGGAGNDHLYGREGNDILRGGAGDDFLSGDGGNNIFQYALGDGADTISRNYYYWEESTETVQFEAGILPDDVKVSVVSDGYDSSSRTLVLTINGGQGEIRVFGYGLSGLPDMALSVRFADGTAWDAAQIRIQAMTGDDTDNVIWGSTDNDLMDGRGGNDYLVGHDGDDTVKGGDGSDYLEGNFGDDNLQGGTGNDYLYGGEGNDTLAGGAGEDTLFGGIGVDTYVVNLGDGRTHIIDYGAPLPDGGNVVRFGEGIDPSQLRFFEDGLNVHIGYGDWDALIIEQMLPAAPWVAPAITRFEFADGSSYTYEQLKNHAPEAYPWMPPAELHEGEQLTYLIPEGTFRDIDAVDSLRYSLSTVNGEVLPAWLVIDPVTGTITGQSGYADSHTSLMLKVTATDMYGKSASSEFALVVHEFNPAPQLAAPIADQDAVEASHFRLEIPAGTFVDADGGEMSYVLSLENNEELPQWLRFDPVNMTLSGTPGDADTGTLRLLLSAIDGGGKTATAEFVLNIANINQAPVLQKFIPDQVATEASVFSLRIPADTFIDPEGGKLTYRVVYAYDESPLPAWLSFDPVTMILSGTPGDGDTGQRAFTLIATDEGGQAYGLGFYLQIANINQAPVLVMSAASASVEDGVPFSYILPEGMFSDADAGDTGVLSSANLPAWLSFDAATRTFSGTPSLADAGQHTLNVSWSDRGGLSATTGFTVSVTPAASVVLNGSASADILTGKSNSDTMNGFGGDDTLDGGIGADRMAGGIGNDIYYVDNAGDLVIENGSEGADTVMASISHTLASNVERVTLTGNAAINATGNALANVLTGNSGANLLDGGANADTMAGGDGSDTYIVDNGSDVVTELAGAGLDRVMSSVGRTLGANQEILTLTGTAAIGGTGNLLNNLIQGNGAINSIGGGEGFDILQGMGGNDVMTDTSAAGNLFDGGDGDDRMNGGAGSDFFAGGAGNDLVGVGSNGADVIAFNRGDGIDSVSVAPGSDNTISLGHGILYADLALAKSGQDLILYTGAGEQIALKGWYSSTTARSVGTLQVVTEGGADYVAGSSSAINDNKIEQFNFNALVTSFDQARAAQPGLSTWSMGSSLAQFSTGGSDTAAIGGDLAYLYATQDSLSAIGVVPALALIGNPQFGAGAQALQSASALNDGSLPLY